MLIKRYVLFIIAVICAACIAYIVIPDTAFSRGIPVFLFNMGIIINIHLIIIILIGLLCIFVPMSTRSSKWDA